ncbi:SDR family NAD(P)-dependent oxidoreductase [Methylosinus sp. Ce-a6]|uniref:SDR family NAD(P)-dependent oxidoreductase n=1 Tax=Methylosinus sp. Ce-a6 TaxID=2172005 RepID=UPI0013577F30|nr:SDR family NAD(P)-dependent oxidoreductase [Methylosinus sp. Ce-a6]
MPLISLETPYPAIVTGASRGVGRAIALALAELGCPVVVNYVANADAAAETVARVEAIGARAVAIRADVTNDADVHRLVDESRRAFGQIGILVNNAGVATRRDIFSNAIEDFDAAFAANTRAAYLVTRLVLPDMREIGWGRLIFLSSTAARTGGVISAPYAGSKAALEGLMRHYAAYAARHGITANAIAPAFIATDMIAGAALPPNMPIQRYGAPEEVAMIAQTIVACGFMTGQTIQVNGGVYMT